MLNRGLFTLLNSRQAKVPPSLSTLCASFRTAGMDVQLRIPNATVYRSYELSLKSNEGSSCALASWNDSCSASHSSVMSRESLRRTLTVVVRRLLESLETFMEHLRVDINNFNGSFSVSMLFSCVIEDTKCNVSCSSGDIDATNWIFATGFQGRDKGVFPEPVYTQRRSIVHQVVLGRHVSKTPFTRDSLDSSRTVLKPNEVV